MGPHLSSRHWQELSPYSKPAAPTAAHSLRIRAFDWVRSLAALVIGIHLLNIIVLSAGSDYQDFNLS